MRTRLFDACTESDKEERMWLAWEVMNCVLKDSGRKVYVCKAKRIKSCTAVLPDSVMQIYAQYLSIVDSQCLQSDSPVLIIMYFHE